LKRTGRRRHYLTMKLVTTISFIILPAFLMAQSEPKINDHFPIKSGDELSPPIVSPVGDCARAVHVSGYLPHALVKVFAP